MRRRSPRCSRKEPRSMLASKTVTELLEAFASPTPTPGGGSAAALSGAVAASLLAMVAAMPKTKNGTPEDRTALDDGAAEAAGAAETADVARSTRTRRRTTASSRPTSCRRAQTRRKRRAKRAVQAAHAHRDGRSAGNGTCGSARIVRPGRVVAEHGNPNAKSDASVAIADGHDRLSGGAIANVEINLDSIGDAPFAGSHAPGAQVRN